MGRASLFLAFAFAVTLAALAGCTRANPAYCCSSAAQCPDTGGELQQCPSAQLCDDDGSLAHGLPHTCIPDPNAQSCAGDPGKCVAPMPACVDNVCVECAADTDCTSPDAPHCHLDLHRCGGCDDSSQCAGYAPRSMCGPSGACVECTPTDPPTESSACSAPPATVCGADGLCRGCQDHRECASGACDLASGACVDPSNIAYVDASASAANTACTDNAKCNTISKGLLTNRAYVVVTAGSYLEDVAIDSRDVTIVAYGAILQAAATTAAAITVTGMSGQVSVSGLTIDGSRQAISCQGAQATATLALTLVDDVITGDFGLGAAMVVRYCDTIMDRDQVLSNLTGGLDLSDSGLEITNSVFSGNGSSSSTFGAVRILDPRSLPSRFAFNTITGNQSRSLGYPGVDCNGTNVVLHSNIIDSNTGNASNAQVSGVGCTFIYSLINPAFAGDHNITGDPMLDATFHINASSPARHAGRPNAGVTEDMDRQPRDTSMPDIGADEFH